MQMLTVLLLGVAIGWVASALRRDLRSPLRSLVQAGLILQARGEVATSAALFIHVSRVEPGNVAAAEAFHQAVVAGQAPEGVLEALTGHLEVHPGDARAHFDLALLHQARGDDARTRDHLERVAALDDGGWRDRACELLQSD